MALSSPVAAVPPIHGKERRSSNCTTSSSDATSGQFRSRAHVPELVGHLERDGTTIPGRRQGASAMRI